MEQTAYPVHTVDGPAGLQNCPLFRIEHFQWKNVVRPRAAGRLAYVPERGFLVHLECLEADPKRTYSAPQSPVCLDSAMEAFFAFTETRPTNDDLYFNFEINANGAMHAKYGAGRKNRTALTAAEYEACGCRAALLPDRWEVQLLVPLPLIAPLTGREAYASGDRFYCNFYKISESPQIEHYAAYRPLDSETPNFHLPACFGEAVLV